MEVYVIRHTPVAAAKDTCYGQFNVPLANTFLQDATIFKNKLPADFDAVYCSPLNRCTALANELNYPNAILNPNLMEMNFGDWENKKWNELDQQILNTWMMDFVNVKVPNGENLLDLYQRVETFVTEISASQHKKVLIITHAGVIRCLWGLLLEIPLKNIFKIPVQHNEVFVFKLNKNPNFNSIIQVV